MPDWKQSGFLGEMTFSTPPSSTLDQHSYESFQRYERDIAQIINNYPKETLLSATPLSPATYISRIRDAINAMRLNGYASQLFTLGQAENVFACLRSGGGFIFTRDSNGLVRCGSKRKLTPRGVVGATDVVLSVAADEIDGRNTEITSAITLLISHGLITQPVTFKNLSALQLSDIQSTPNIELVETEPGTYIIL